METAATKNIFQVSEITGFIHFQELQLLPINWGRVFSLSSLQLPLVTLSNGIQVNPDIQIRESFRQALGVQDLLYPDRRIEAFANKEGMPFLMLVPTLAKWAETNNSCVHGFPNAIPCGVYWNDHGHELAGELIARKIC